METISRGYGKKLDLPPTTGEGKLISTQSLKQSWRTLSYEKIELLCFGEGTLLLGYLSAFGEVLESNKLWGFFIGVSNEKKLEQKKKNVMALWILKTYHYDLSQNLIRINLIIYTYDKKKGLGFHLTTKL